MIIKLQIDNFDGRGLVDYSTAIDISKLPDWIRKINDVVEVRFSLIAEGPEFVVPVVGARVLMGRTNGQDVFTGYLTAATVGDYLGWGERGPAFRYNLVAESDEGPLDRRRLPIRSPFVERSAGDALRQVTQDLLPGMLDVSEVQDVDILAAYTPDSRKTWSQHAAEIALQAQACYRTSTGALLFQPVGTTEYTLAEDDSNFVPQGLKLESKDRLINDVTILGDIEPQAYVKDYFVGDGYSMKFYLSQAPFTSFNQTLVNEEYKGNSLDVTRWKRVDPSNAISVSGGKLQISGGTNADGATTVSFAEKVELGGAMVLQHGDVAFTAASTGVLGGLYTGSASIGSCVAGFRITPNGAQSTIQALVNGSVTGATMNTVAGHHYAFTTRFYSREVYRKQQTFHSTSHPAGNGRGGAAIAADVRVVLDVHDIDPANPGSLIAMSTVLYDGVIANAPDFCQYVLVNSANMHCGIAFTRIVRVPETEVRSALPGQSYRTRLIGALSDGAECTLFSGPALDFFNQYAPAINELIEVRYRGRGRSAVRVTNSASIAAHVRGIDDGVRGVVKHVKSPAARTSADCENAALAIMDDATGTAWQGEYEVWSDFLPDGASDIFPGDALTVNVPSRNASFRTIVREVRIAMKDLDGGHSIYKIAFADNALKPLGFEFETGQASIPIDTPQLEIAQTGNAYMASLTAAEITQVSSTTTTLDAGFTPAVGSGIEVRWSDAGWGQDNDRNLVGRFSTQSFTVPRLAKTEDYFLRLYDSTTPPKYSRYSTALHIKNPL